MEVIYNYICFNYIYYNLVKVEMVFYLVDWFFLFVVEYVLFEVEGLCNKLLVYELGFLIYWVIKLFGELEDFEVI